LTRIMNRIAVSPSYGWKHGVRTISTEPELCAERSADWFTIHRLFDGCLHPHVSALPMITITGIAT
jgi:hypothetical protein